MAANSLILAKILDLKQLQAFLMCAGPSEVADDGQDHHGGQVFVPEDRLDVLLPLSDAAVSCSWC